MTNRNSDVDNDRDVVANDINDGSLKKDWV